jgi:hypothetical protein
MMIMARREPERNALRARGIAGDVNRFACRDYRERPARAAKPNRNVAIWGWVERAIALAPIRDASCRE